MPRKSLPEKANPHATLNPKQIAFAVNYAVSGNGTDAAKRAGYSEKAAAQQATHLLKNPKIQALIADEQAQRWKRLQMSGDETLARIAQLARTNIKGMFGPDGEIKSPAEVDEWTAYGVAGIEAQLKFEDDGAPPEKILKIKMRDPTPALRILAQHHKLIGAEVQVNLTEELADRLANARKRARAKQAEAA